MANSHKIIQAAAGTAGGDPVYVEDVFSTYLYEGDGQSDRDIVNGIDLATNGGLVWLKTRSTAYNHFINSPSDVTGYAQLPSTGAWTTSSNIVTFNENGFRIPVAYSGVNATNSTSDMSSWTFRKQAGFFDVKTFTAESDQFVDVNHDLGCNIGAVMYKETNGTGDWNFWHKSFSENDIIKLNTTAAKQTGQGLISSQTSSSARFYTDANTTSTYVAYFFGDGDDSNAQIFGDGSDEAIIKCGSFTEGTNVSVNVGFEPQWLLYKAAGGADSWRIIDSMRGVYHTSSAGDQQSLYPNLSNAEGSESQLYFTTTGFFCDVAFVTGNSEIIYIAIRRPMKTPEAGTEVFKPVARSGNSTAGTSIACGFPLDWVVTQGRNGAIEPLSYTRLQGSHKKLKTYNTTLEGSPVTPAITSFDQDGMTVGTDADINSSFYTYINWFFKRASTFFEQVAYTGTGSNRTISHNLNATPDMMIIRRRDSGGSWIVWHSGYSVYSTPTGNYYMRFNSNGAIAADATLFNSTTPTSSVFSVGTSTDTNASSGTYIAWLFAEVAGISKFGSYTADGTTTDIDCGFSSGARFVMIKRVTPGSGDWFIFDTARGIVAGSDPYQYWNSAGTETTGNDYLDPLSSGFTITSSATWINLDTYKYIFWAIA